MATAGVATTAGLAVGLAGGAAYGLARARAGCWRRSSVLASAATCAPSALRRSRDGGRALTVVRERVGL